MSEARTAWRFLWRLAWPIGVLVLLALALIFLLSIHFFGQHERLQEHLQRQNQMATLALGLAATAMELEVELDEMLEGVELGHYDEAGIYRIHRRLVNRFDAMERRLERLCSVPCPELAAQLSDLRALAQMATEVGAVEIAALPPYKDLLRRRNVGFLAALSEWVETRARATHDQFETEIASQRRQAVAFMLALFLLGVLIALPAMRIYGQHARKLSRLAQALTALGEKLNAPALPALSAEENDSLTAPLVQALRRLHEALRERAALLEQLDHLASHDALTGLPNRALFTDRLDQALAQARRSQARLAVGYLDLDGFKPINDRFGHQVGDKVLIEIARRLRQVMRAGDTVARMGGDEFAFLLPNLESSDAIDEVCQRLLGALSAPCEIDGLRLQVGASIGVTLFPDDAGEAETLLRHADQALYAAKSSGRGRWVYFDVEDDKNAAQRRAWLNEVRRALALREFELFYQPKVGLRSGELLGCEALLRWRHAQKGLLSPGEFLPFLAGTPLELELDTWVIAEALRQIAAWRAEGEEIAVAVNLSPRFFALADFGARLAALLAQHADAPPRLLQLELVESSLVADYARTQAAISAANALGVTVALDDFGAGYAVFAHLRLRGLAALKIEGSFVASLAAGHKDLPIIEAIVGLGQAFDLLVVAEGVESEAVGLTLLHLGCEAGQGYGISKPMPAAELLSWKTHWQPPLSWRQAPRALAGEEAALYAAETAHRAWLAELFAWLAAPAREAPENDPRACVLGRWLAASARFKYGGLPAFDEIVALHARVHEAAARLIEAGRANESLEARRREVESASTALLSRLIDFRLASFGAREESKGGYNG
ncbi:MAG: EAL domain-containing protein [Rhodocyclaceae bacterium]|nr:EAL domain-containing protein [Rhodocyclaceae bacterium]